MKTPSGIESHNAPKISILMASSEIAPYAKTGGLGDVIGSLPPALAKAGAEVSLVMPAYSSVLNGGYVFDGSDLHVRVAVSDRIEAVEILRTKTGQGIPIYFVRADKYFDREFLYGTPDGDYPDNAERFVLFSRAVLELARLLKPQILHVNDWQTALAIAFLRSEPARYPEIASTRTVITIHNLGYQGRFRRDAWHLLDTDWSLFTPRHFEFYGDINFLKAGVVFADIITTVSPTYAHEIQTTEQGFGLEGVFQERADSVFGVINGVDYSVWNPETDVLIAQNFGAKDTTGKIACASDLRSYFGLAKRNSAPIVAMVTRLSAQKGVELVRDAFSHIIRRGCQFVMVGTGERPLQRTFQGLGRRYRGQAGVEIVFSELVAHKIIAGSDILLMPSRYEPGGLTHLYGFKYGTIPVARATGGLKDTISPFQAQTAKGNGFLFSEYAANQLISAIDRALDTYGKGDLWTRLIQNAMLSDFSWKRSAQQYLDIYARAIAGSFHP